jgi:hypothetical protein
VEVTSRNKPGNTKVRSITVPLTSSLTGLDKSVLQIKTKLVGCHTADSKSVKQVVNGTVILPLLVIPEQTHSLYYVAVLITTIKSFFFLQRALG